MGDETHVVFFDGVCLFCNETVQFLLKWDRNQCFFFAPLQGKLGARLQLEQRNLDSVVLVTSLGTPNQRLFMGAAAVIEIVSKLPFPWRCVEIFRVLPAGMLERIYQCFAKRRYAWFGKSETCMIPEPEQATRFLD